MGENKTGMLYVVATPIGDPADITLRALETLRNVDAVICEELRTGSTLLKKIGVQTRILVDLNEHNEKTRIPEMLQMLMQGNTLALISDCGTPVFADPGSLLIREAVEYGIRVSPIPGPSSLMAALSILDRNAKQFIYAGFLARDPVGRRSELERLKRIGMTTVVMDTPYRLSAVLSDVAHIFGSGARITLAIDLTLPGEQIFRGRISNAITRYQGAKREFILIIY
jgi:16S rRNA (cytidine1402-2'-O)-methyltransferase